MKNQSTNLVITLNDTQKTMVDQAINTGKSFYQNVKALFESDLVIRELFLTKTSKEIVTIVYGEEALSKAEFALTENRNRTSFGNALHNLKKLCKAQFEDKKESPTIKKMENVLKDLSNLAENFSSYKEDEKNSILNQIESMIRDINKTLPKGKGIKIK